MRRRALIVDDNRALAEDLAEILELEGYEVSWFDDSTRALRECAGRSFAVALLDMRMPGLDGVALHRELLAQHPNTIFFLMTAYTDDDRIAVALAAGVREVLTKPVPLPELLDVLERASDERREVLLLDDDRAFNANLSEVLQEHGYQVRVAHSLSELRSTTQQSFRAAIIDMCLPDGDGAAFAVQLARTSQVAVILISGFDLADQKPNLVREFGERVRVIVKPFPPDVLLQALLAISGAHE
jgi:DNA-binding response OmpR family regulator